MLCNICHKNEAKIYFKGIFNNKVLKISMCEECAEKKGLKIESNSVLSELFSTLTDIDLPVAPAKEKKSGRCQTCGLTYAEFKDTRRLGCGDCYTTFASYLTPLITKIHGSSKYVGKKELGVETSNKQALLKQKLEELKSELDRVVKNEEYERATELRDQIRELKKKLEINS